MITLMARPEDDVLPRSGMAGSSPGLGLDTKGESL